MCTVCGCGQGETRIEGEDQDYPHDHPHDHGHGHAHEHTHADGTVHSHSHGHDHDHGAAHDQAVAHEHPHNHAHEHPHAHPHEHAHEHAHAHADGSVHSHPHGHSHSHEHLAHDHDHGALHDPAAAHDHAHDHGQPEDLHFGLGPAHAHAPGLSQGRMVSIERDILAKNDAFAAENRRRLAGLGVFALNLVSSPGSGKTSLLVRTIEALRGRVSIAVVEGDQQTSADADRIRATGAPAIQINTGKGCHLDAQMVARAIERLNLPERGLLLIENVGNLVCPAAFDLGEAHKVVILSVTEGEDKPLKYPDMFHAAGLMLINKTDLLPHVDFDVERCIEYAHRVRPGLPVIQVSARTGEGMDAWVDWLLAGLGQPQAGAGDEVLALRRRVAELEARLADLSGGSAGA